MEQQFELNFSPPPSSPDTAVGAEEESKHPFEAAFDSFIEDWPDGVVYAGKVVELARGLLQALNKGQHPDQHARLSEAVAAARDESGLSHVSEVAQEIIKELE
jgi:hypothetical protein